MLHVFPQTMSAALPAGPAGGAGGCSPAEGEGRGGGQAGSAAGQEGEGDPEEGHQEGEAEAQDHLQGSVLAACRRHRCPRVQPQSFLTSNALLYPLQTWNYFADNEADSVKMMEEVEKLCDRLELTR